MCVMIPESGEFDRCLATKGTKMFYKSIATVVKSLFASPHLSPLGIKAVAIYRKLTRKFACAEADEAVVLGPLRQVKAI